MAARHRLDAVLAAGEARRLQGEEEHHLGERQGDHGEVDALSADGESAEEKAEKRRDGDAEQDGELGRQAPNLGRVGGHVAGHAEIGGVPEGQEPAIAEQEIEGAGEQREAQHLHEEHGIEDQRRHEQQHGEADEDDPVQALRRLRVGKRHADRRLDRVALSAIRRPSRTIPPASPRARSP